MLSDLRTTSRDQSDFTSLLTPLAANRGPWPTFGILRVMAATIVEHVITMIDLLPTFSLESQFATK